MDNVYTFPDNGTDGFNETTTTYPEPEKRGKHPIVRREIVMANPESKGGVEVSPEDVQSAINAYLTENPIEGIGAAGKSAYEIAVDNGFSGSEAEWLESLHDTTLEEQIIPVSEAVDAEIVRYNLFDCTDITDNKYRAMSVGSDVNSLQDHEKGWCSNQRWDVKSGDVIYTSQRYMRVHLYNAQGKLVTSITDMGTQKKYTIDNDNVAFMTIQASEHNDIYLYKIMLSINRPLPSEYKAYSDVELTSNITKLEKQIPKNGRNIIDKGFIVLSFDDFNLNDDDRFNIVNSYGFKASGSIAVPSGGVPTTPSTTIKELYKTMLEHGWDAHLYNGSSRYPTADSYYVDNPSAAVQTAWDAYVKQAVDYAELNGITNVTAWGARQGRSCTGLENACKKYGIKMVRGAKEPRIAKYSEDFAYSVISPVSLISSNLQECITAVQEAAQYKYGINFTTHKLWSTSEEATQNYGLTEADLRVLLDAIKTLVDNGQLKVVTFRDVYRMYYPNDANANDYERLSKLAASEDTDIDFTTLLGGNNS